MGSKKKGTPDSNRLVQALSWIEERVGAGPSARTWEVPLVIHLPTALLACLALQAADWPQYRGPARDDVSLEKGLLDQWPAEGPALLWTFANAGIGYSGPAVVGDRLYTIGGRGDVEFLVAVDVKTGKEAWATPVGPLYQFEGNRWSAGPSATPTVAGGLVFALGGNGDLLCANAATGKEVWRKNLPKELDAQVNPIGGGPKNLGWGFTG